MKRVLNPFGHNSRADRRLFCFTFISATLVLLLSLTPATRAATAYYSFTGGYADGTETQSFLFNLNSTLRSVAPFTLRTWHYGGGTNAAGDTIAAGGFDPILRLYNDTPTLIAENDDFNSPTVRDSLINWSTSGMPTQLPADNYQLNLVAYNNTLGGRTGNWAVDLLADAAKFTLTGVAANNGTGTTTINSLAIGSDDVRLPAKVQVGPLTNMSIVGPLIVGDTGSGEVTVTTGALDTNNGAIGYSHSYLGFEPGSIGNVTLRLGGSWSDNQGSNTIGWQGEGNLRVESGSLAAFEGPVVLAEYGGSEGNVTVTGNDSYLVTNSAINIGEAGTGYLRIENEGHVSSTGLGTVGADTVGVFGQGTAEVDGADSLWTSGALYVGYAGQGIVRITNGGKLGTTGNAYIAKTASAAASSVTVSGMSPQMTKAAWEISSNLFIAGDENGPSSAPFSKLAIMPGGRVDVSGTTTVWNGGGDLELLGGEMETGSLVVKPGATFTHTDGTLTIDGGVFDPGVADYRIDGANTVDQPIVRMTMGASASPALFNAATVGDFHRGRLEIVSGSHLELDGLYVGSQPSGEGEVVIDGHASSMTTSIGFSVGWGGHGVLRVLNGGSLHELTAPYVPIGALPGADGAIEVSGMDDFNIPSTYNTGGSMWIGRDGLGTLTVSAGGRVNAFAGAAIAMYPAGSGSSATVTGQNSQWIITGPLYLGGIDVSAGGTGKLTVANGGLVGVDSVKVWQPGTIELSGGTIHTGEIILEGTLRGTGQVIGAGQISNSGIVSPGLLAPGMAVGSIHVAGDYVQLANGALKMEIGGTAPNQIDRLEVDGTATLGGSLRVALVDPTGGTNPYLPSAGNTFLLVSAGLLGPLSFNDIILPDLGPDLRFAILGDLLNSQLLAKVFWNGDYNFDGRVDAADYVVWRETYRGPNMPPPSLAADGDGDGDVDNNDWNVWRAHFGKVASPIVPAGGSVVENVPEPTATVLLLLNAIVLYFATRRWARLVRHY